MSEIKVTEVKVKKTSNLNERDYINDLLSNEKQLCTNMMIFLTETSNLTLHKEVEKMLEKIVELQRKTFDLAWNKGWYQLCSVEETEKEKTYNKLLTKFEELNN